MKHHEEVFFVFPQVWFDHRLNRIPIYFQITQRTLLGDVSVKAHMIIAGHHADISSHLGMLF